MPNNAVKLVTDIFEQEITRSNTRISEIENSIMELQDDREYPALFTKLHEEIDFQIEMQKRISEAEYHLGDKPSILSRIFNRK